MRHALVAAFAVFGAVTFGAASRHQTPPAPGTVRLIPVSGVVLTPEQRSTPVPSVTVTVTDVTGRTPAQNAQTDQNGRFSFEGLPAGRYDVSATKGGYLKTSFGMLRPERAGTPITLSSGEPAPNVTLRIWRGAVISGVIRDPTGRPLPATSVLVRRFQFVNGVRTLATSASGLATTDDRGMYRIFGLPPGEYAVLTPSVGAGGGAGTSAPRQVTSDDVERALRGRSVNAAPTPSPAAPSPPSQQMGYAPVYFPGTPVVLQATPVIVEAGEERSDVDFAVSLVPVASVAGAVGLPGGAPIDDLQIVVSLVARSAPGDLLVSRSATAGPDGKFGISSVAPGDYLLSARATRKSVTAANATGEAAGWWAALPVSVNGADILAAGLTLQPGITVSGRIVLDGGPPPDAISASLRLTPRGERPSAQPFVVSANGVPGTFTIPGVVPGEYVLSVVLTQRVGSTASWTFKKASVGSQDVTDRPFTIAPGQASGAVTVALTNRRTQLIGVFQDAAGRPAPGFFIVALPTDRALWQPGSRRIVQTRPATDGRFTIDGLPAGDYALAVTTDLVPTDLVDPAFLAQLIAAPVVKVTLTEGTTVTQDIRIAADTEG